MNDQQPSSGENDKASRPKDDKDLPKHVRIHIDRQPYHSPNLTTGTALYLLGKVRENHLLYRESQGEHEDQPMPRGQNEVCLTEDEHFYSAEDHKRGIRIIVNAREEVLYRHRVSYEHVVKLAYPTPPSPEVIGYIVTYYKGHEHQLQGDLTAGRSVRICNGMVFNVTPTNRS